MALELRGACVADLPSIYRGEQDYIRCWEPEHEVDWVHDFERHLARWVGNFDRLIIAVIDDQFAGYSLWMPERGSAELCTTHVSRQHRRNGVGRALLESYMAQAARDKFEHLALSVRADNPARGLYERAVLSEQVAMQKTIGSTNCNYHFSWCRSIRC